MGGKYSQYETSKKRRRKFTLHSFRRYVLSTISDLGYSDFSQYFIGHSTSTYYRRPEKERYELFRKVEPHLTFLDITALERKGADIQTKVESLEIENQRLRNREEKLNRDLQEVKRKTDRINDILEKSDKLKKRFKIS